jgi:prepilin-type N-terminal cleavage/methylation domain-containing protein
MARKGFTLIELLVVIAIIGLLASIVLVSLNSARAKARDAKRVSELKQIQTAIELYYDRANSYVVGDFFSVWDTTYSHSINYWSTGNPPASTALYDALVGNGYLNLLPLDPGNREGGAGNYLGDGPPIDQGYVYYSDNGQRYILGTNLERGGASPNYWGNYQIKWGAW